MKALIAFITALTIPLGILNIRGGVVSAVWLAVLGDWRIIGSGVLVFIVSSTALGFALLPGMLLAVPAALFLKKGKSLGMLFFGALSSIYVFAIIAVWCCGVLFFFVKDATGSNLIPRLIWSYGLATGPWAYMATKESEGGEAAGASMLATFLAQLAYVTIMVIVIFTSITVLGALKVFAGFMCVGLIIQLTLATLVQNEARRAAQLPIGPEATRDFLSDTDD